MSPIGNPLGREMHWSKKQRGPRAPRCRIQSSKKQGSARPARTGAGTATAAGSATALRAGTGAEHRLRPHRQQGLALHLPLQRLEGLIDIVIANENLHAASSFN